MTIVIVHWGEHLFQAYQVFVLHWPRSKAMGMIGLMWPWLMMSEWLHYGFALIMLVGLWVLRKGFVGLGHTWWMIAFWIQFWHHIEHALLFFQVQTHHYLFGGAVPTSIAQIWIPRVELHLFYNAVVFIPMLIGMYYHVYPPASETARPMCTCARRHPALAGAAA
ncbi:MAG TPA: hypothetical protein VM736_07775 [Gemmatimonadales bacterium]|nr:hypothetical protein [Gemmatimonadales bacterium]